MITIIKFINRLIRNKTRLKRKWRRIGHFEGFQAGRKSAQKEMVGIREMAKANIDEITYKVKEEVHECHSETYNPQTYGVTYHFRPEHSSYRLYKEEEIAAKRISE